MTLTLIGAAILCVAVAGIAVFLRHADVILGLRHRGEVADAPDDLGADDIDGADACALTRPLSQPLEHVPPIRHPGLWDREQEMAGTPADRLAQQLATRSKQ